MNYNDAPVWIMVVFIIVWVALWQWYHIYLERISRQRMLEAMHIPPQPERETEPLPEWVEGLDEQLAELGKP